MKINLNSIFSIDYLPLEKETFVIKYSAESHTFAIRSCLPPEMSKECSFVQRNEAWIIVNQMPTLNY